MGTFFKVVLFPTVIATLFVACGGGGSTPGDSAPPTLGDDATLSALSVSTGSLNETFASGRYAYTQDTGAFETRVTPSVSDANAAVTVNGEEVASGTASGQIALNLGANSITVVVTAEDGSTTQTYTITITRLSNDANLSGLSLSTGEIDQMFQAAVHDYTASVGYTQTSVMITAEVTSIGASVTVNGATVLSGQPSEEIPLVEGLNTVPIVVTAEDGETRQTYTLHITRQTANSFIQQAYIKASNTAAGDQFGYSVSVSGDTLAVGGQGEDSSATGINGNQADNSARNSGAVYVFTRDDAGLWSQEAYIKASNTDANDLFGISVSLSGDTLAVGAPGEGSAVTGIDGDQFDNTAPGSGAVYIFSREAGGIWRQQAYVKPSVVQSGDRFGNSVALSDDTLAVGAPYEDSSATGVDGNQADNNADASGAVYVFARDAGGNWSQQAYLKASNTEAQDWFGWSVALSGDTVAVATHWEDSAAIGINGNQLDNTANAAGAAYVFTRDPGGTWSQQAYIKASNTEDGDMYGYSVALSGDTLAVGAINEDSAATGVGGDQANNFTGASGAVYVYVRDAAGNWSQQAYVKASNAGFLDYFGHSVGLSGDSLAVGAYYEDSAATGIGGNETDDNAPQSGAVYLFARDSGGNWSQHAYVKASNTEAQDWFGFSVALSGDTIAVGTHSEDSAATGIGGDETDNSAPDASAVYVFH